MLSRVLKEFENSQGPLTLSEMSRRLGVERSALEGMLQLLVRKGKLREVRPGDVQCSHCGSRTGCGTSGLGALMGTSYELVGATRGPDAAS